MNDEGTLHEHEGKAVIRFERRLPHPVAAVWVALTEPEELRGWWGDADVELREGGTFVLRWLNGDADGNSAVMHATITALDPPRLLETTGDIHGVLRWELQPDGDGTLLVFSSTLDLPDEFRTQTLAGWHWHLDRLTAALDGAPYDWSTWDVADWEPTHRRYVERGV